VAVWGDAKLDLSSTGEILGGTIGIDAAPGQVLLPWLAATPLRIDGGHLALSYNRDTRRFDIAPSVLVWGDSRVQFTGSIVHDARDPKGPGGPSTSTRLAAGSAPSRRCSRAWTSTTGPCAASSGRSGAASCSAVPAQGGRSGGSPRRAT